MGAGYLQTIQCVTASFLVGYAMEITDPPPSPLQPIRDEQTERAGVSLFMKRDDLISGPVSGNKWRKLKYNLRQARECGARRLLTFGGAFSNHIHAFAAAGQHFGFETIGIIRGEAHEPLNPVLAFARECGMRIDYLDREAYRQKDTSAVLNRLGQRHAPDLIIPEGGSNALALSGCAALIREIDRDFDILCTPCGTGGTLAGLVIGLEGRGLALGFAVLKGGGFLKRDVADFLAQAQIPPHTNWELVTKYHCGGYARKSEALVRFMQWFRRAHGIELDFVYTGKMLYGLYDLMKSGFFDRRTRIIALHTGGLQTAGLSMLD